MTSGNLLEYNKEVDDGGKGGRDREQRDSTMENAEFKARIIAIITQLQICATSISNSKTEKQKVTDAE